MDLKQEEVKDLQQKLETKQISLKTYETKISEINAQLIFISKNEENIKQENIQLKT